MEPVVQLRGAVTLLGRFPALAGIDLEVAAGEMVLLRGPNGAGKTTLLRCCAGLVPLARGEARVLGHDLADRRQAAPAAPRRPARPRHRACTRSSPWPTTCGSGAGPPARAPEDIDAALDACGLGGRLPDLAVARLSAGQRRRTALACLVARRPELWLLDEPHAGLDHEGRDLIDDLVHRAQAAGATSSSPPTSSTGPRPSPTGSSPSRAAPSRRRRPRRRPPRSRVLVP